MCLAIPGKLIEITTDPAGVKMGRANFGGIVKQVCLEYTPEAEAGDYVLVHVGFALSKVDEVEAARTYQLLEEMKQLGELDVPEVMTPDLQNTEEPSSESVIPSEAERSRGSPQNNRVTRDQQTNDGVLRLRFAPLHFA